MPSETLKGHIAMGAAAVIWGLMSPVSKLVMQQGEVSSASLATFRLLGAAILFWLASAFVPGEPIERKHRLPLFYASLFGIIFNQMAFTVGVGFTSPADAAIITTITPVLTMILAAFVLREMITGKKIIGVCASAIGAILLVSGSGGRAAALPGDNNLLGDILCLASQCSVAVYFVFFKNLIGRYSPITLLKWMFTYAAAACLPFTFREVGSIHYSALPAQTWLGIAYVVALATFVSYICLSFAQQRLKPTAVSMYNYCQPVIASSVAVMWGMDHFGWMKVLSVLLVFTGVLLVTGTGEKGPSRNNKHAIPPDFRRHAPARKAKKFLPSPPTCGQSPLTSRPAMRRPVNHEKIDGKFSHSDIAFPCSPQLFPFPGIPASLP